MRKLLLKRKECRLIISSATLDTFSKTFSTFFKDSTVIHVEGRQFDVETFYLEKPCYNYLHETVELIKNIHLSEIVSSGDILVFLPGKDDLEAVYQMLKDDFDASEFGTSF